jgi:glycerol-3-phosphate dehydrogenase
VSGAALRDTLTGDIWETSAKVIVNAAGPFSDAVRHMDDPNAPKMLSASSGAHIVLDKRFSPPETGLLIPQTEDGRVLFLLPWLGHTLVGTTDNPAEIEPHPKATEEDIAYILRHVEKYFSIPVSRTDVKAAWSGLRPLVSNINASDTAKLSRDHVITISDAGLLTITGGKWTTYRKMSLDAVNEAVRLGDLSAGESKTETLKLLGGRNFSSSGAGQLEETYGVDHEVSSYLNRAYGDQAEHVAKLAHDGYGARLAEGHAYLEAEVIYAAQAEAARSSTDILARRTRLAFLDNNGAKKAIPRVSALLAKQLGWSSEHAAKDVEEAQAYIQ